MFKSLVTVKIAFSLAGLLDDMSTGRMPKAKCVTKAGLREAEDCSTECEWTLLSSVGMLSGSSPSDC